MDWPQLDQQLEVIEQTFQQVREREGKKENEMKRRKSERRENVKANREREKWHEYEERKRVLAEARECKQKQESISKRKKGKT